MSTPSKYNFGTNNQYENLSIDRNINIGKVINIKDPLDLGRIQVRVLGLVEFGGDNGISDIELPWVTPMMPKILHIKPKKGESVFIVSTGTNELSRKNRLYFGPIIGQPDTINFTNPTDSPIPGLNFGAQASKPNSKQIPDLKGIYPNDDDIALQGRNNTDIILKNNELLLRANKHISNTPSKNNVFNIKFNKTTPTYIQLKGDVNISKPNEPEKLVSIANIVSSKINLLTHENGSPRFNLSNQDNLISDEEMIKILEEAHPLAFGDILLQYLKLMKDALLNHVHNGHGNPATDLTITNLQSINTFKSKAETLEKLMLSKNIRIN